MSARLQKDLCKQIVESWLGARSNYIVVAPPMSGESDFVSLLAKRELHYEVLAEKISKFSLACLDSANFRNDLDFAWKVSSSWGVPRKSSDIDDAVTVLESACNEVIARGSEPVLIVQRFHEALERLGESIGTALRNLEHTHRLKTVVTMPVKLTTLRERWELMGNGLTPFLASDWGQGHTTKLLSGYSKDEIEALIKQGRNAPEQAETLYKATAGYTQLVDRLIDDIGERKSRGLEAFLRSRSAELCQRLVRWLEAPNSSHAFKKALVNLEHPELYVKSVELIACHDWAASIVNKNGDLNFKMVAWACQDFLARQPGHSWLPTLAGHIKRKDAKAAIALTEAISQIAGAHDTRWQSIEASLRLTRLGESFFSEDEDWAALRLDINRLMEVLSNSSLGSKFLPALNQWSSLFIFLENYQLHKKVHPEIRLERYACESAEGDCIPLFLQFLSLRLIAAGSLTAFQGIQSVVTMPESILQVYGFKRHNLIFWGNVGLAEKDSSEFQSFVGYAYRLENTILGHSDLAHLIAFFSSKYPGGTLISDKERLRYVLDKYELRKELAHSTAFASVGDSKEYQAYCFSLLKDARADLEIDGLELDIDLFFSISDLLMKDVPVLYAV